MSATGEVQPQPRVEFDLSSKVDLADSMGTYFKSSFAKSMALSSDQQSKSLDCSALNASLRARADTEFGLAAARGRGGPTGPGPDPGVERDSTAKVRRESCIPRGGPPAQAQPQGASRTRTQEDAGHSDAAKELARLRKELQTLQEENRRLQTGAQCGGAGPGRPSSVLLQPDTADMVDNVLLQNQVDTLQWQLRQTENSRHMYRAVMEQVVRFLERAHRNLKLAAGAGAGPRPKTPNGRVPRSRSVHTVDVCPGRSSPRDSLPDFQRAKSITQIEDTQSYSAFRDFTWRRPRPSQSDLEEVPPEKLSQEAFRLLRTVQSLLNTREPDLAHRLSGSASGSGDSEPRSEPRSERSSVVSLDHPDDSSQTSPTPTANGSVKDGPGPHGDRLVADVAGALRRKLNIRNSQVVSCASYNRLREFASESNSNSSTAEDCDYDTGPASLLSGLESAFSGSHHGQGQHHRLEEARQALRKEEAERDRDRLLHRKHAPPTPQPSLSSAEDESGFSSMGSFQEVGLPLLSSTQLNGTSDPPAAAAGTTPWHNLSTASSCTTAASPARSHGSFHEVGLPVPLPVSRQHLRKPPVPIHRRWSSNPVEAIARSAYKGTEALRVLWV